MRATGFLTAIVLSPVDRGAQLAAELEDTRVRETSRAVPPRRRRSNRPFRLRRAHRERTQAAAGLPSPTRRLHPRRSRRRRLDRAARRRKWPSVNCRANLMHPFALSTTWASAFPLDKRSTKSSALQAFQRSGASETRTRDLLGAIQALSQLSYSPARRQRAARSPQSSLECLVQPARREHLLDGSRPILSWSRCSCAWRSWRPNRQLRTWSPPSTLCPNGPA